MNHSAVLKQLLQRDTPQYFLEAHNALSALVVQEAGFPAIWGSSLAMSAARGCRDANELTMTEMLDELESITDRVTIPVLFDGGTGFGTFNHFQRLVRKLIQRNVAGVCIEDQPYPKSNSLLGAGRPSLAPVSEFCAKIRAGADARTSGDLVLVARTEAFIAGLGVNEALDRASRYVEAGADAVLVHSRASHSDEIASFMEQWANKAPIVCVPTTYWNTAPEIFENLGIAAVIWANHLIRTSLSAMQQTAQELRTARSSQSVVPRIAPLPEVFRMQDFPGLEAAERRYNSGPRGPKTAVILAAGMGTRLQTFASDTPKSLLTFDKETLIGRSMRLLRAQGVERIVLVVGYAKEALAPLAAPGSGVELVENPDYKTTGTMASLAAALRVVKEDFLLLEGDIIYEPRALEALVEDPRPDVVLASGFTGASDEVWIEAEADRLVHMSKDHRELHSIAGELVGVCKVSAKLAEEMLYHFEVQVRELGHARISYETDVLAQLAKRRSISLRVISDLCWGEVDYEAHYERVRDFVVPMLQQRDSR